MDCQICPLSDRCLKLVCTMALSAGLSFATMSEATAKPVGSGEIDSSNPHKQKSKQRRTIPTIGKYRLTYYWLVHEVDYPSEDKVTLLDIELNPLAVVSADFANDLYVEGTGVLVDGSIVNLYDECESAPTGWCYFLVDTNVAPFGWGSGAPLHPHLSVALDGASSPVPPGTIVYLQELDGLEVSWQGARWIHDGCLAVVDSGWSLTNRSLDLFVGSWENYAAIDPEVASVVTLKESAGHCPKSVEELYGW